jgi:hypothetical protein
MLYCPLKNLGQKRKPKKSNLDSVTNRNDTLNLTGIKE